jgi:hypothetical protein
MTLFYLEKGKKYRSITFLCQDCHGELEATAEQYAGDRVWRCQGCTAVWIYTLAGWGRIMHYRPSQVAVIGNV